MYDPEKQVIDLENPLFEAVPKLDGNLLAIDNKGETQIIEINENIKRSRNTKDFRIKQNKTNQAKRLMNNNDNHFGIEKQIRDQVDFRKLSRATSQPNFRNIPGARTTMGQAFQVRYGANWTY